MHGLSDGNHHGGELKCFSNHWAYHWFSLQNSCSARISVQKFLIWLCEFSVFHIFESLVTNWWVSRNHGGYTGSSILMRDTICSTEYVCGARAGSWKLFANCTPNSRPPPHIESRLWLVAQMKKVPRWYQPREVGICDQRCHRRLLPH